MGRIPKAIKKFSTSLIYVFSIVGFYLLCILLYEPKAAVELLHAGEGISIIENVFPLNISIICAIILISLLLTRSGFYFIGRHNDISLLTYLIWCIGEVLMCSSFIALYITLMNKGSDNYFIYLGQSISTTLSLMIYPYSLLTLIFYYNEARNDETITDETKIKFYDNRHLLKFVVMRSSILYIEAHENYLRIHYLENDREKSYELRNTMKSVEEISRRAGFVRIHRSFIANPSYVKMVAKGADGHYFATISTPSAEELPVSKKYQENITALL